MKNIFKKKSNKSENDLIPKGISKVVGTRPTSFNEFASKLQPNNIQN